MTKTMNYEELYEKMLNDEEFLSKTKKCESFEELYKLYCDYGYTDLEYESFKSAFEARVNQLEANGSKYQLSVDELDTVVGGSLWGWVKKAINFVPFVGPLVTTTLEVCTGELKGEDVVVSKETIYHNAQIRSACASHNITDIGYGDILKQVKSEELRI